MQKYVINFEKSLLEVGDPSILGEFPGNFGEFPIVNHKGKSRVADFASDISKKNECFYFDPFLLEKYRSLLLIAVLPISLRRLSS